MAGFWKDDFGLRSLGFSSKSFGLFSNLLDFLSHLLDLLQNLLDTICPASHAIKMRFDKTLRMRKEIKVCLQEFT